MVAAKVHQENNENKWIFPEKYDSIADDIVKDKIPIKCTLWNASYHGQMKLVDSQFINYSIKFWPDESNILGSDST